MQPKQLGDSRAYAQKVGLYQPFSQIQLESGSGQNFGRISGFSWI